MSSQPLNVVLSGAGPTEVAQRTTVNSAQAEKRYLFGPIMDFLCLGGSSLILLPIIALLPDVQYREPIAAMMLMLAHAINHPHFAHSYQIFYRGYATKAFTPALGQTMRMRYLFAGLVAPALLLLFFAWGTFQADPRLLGYAANLMALAVGWHYVKQGYGMLMVDAALKRRFFKDDTKRVFLINCYVVWIASWLSFNAAAHQQDLWGLAYYTFAVPQPVVIAAACAAAFTGAATLAALWQHKRRAGGLPVNGLIAYGVSLYVWLMFIAVDPLWGLVVPALHSIQYLIVVYRYQLNYEKDQLRTEQYKAGSLARKWLGTNAVGHLILFFVYAATLGYLGFWFLPVIAGLFVPHDEAVLGPTFFLFVFWIFINVHHYLLDNVMWRRENPDTRKYLFG